MAGSARVFAQGCRVLMSAAKNSSASITTASNTKTTTTKIVRPSGITKPVPVSSELGKFLGVSEASRADAVKKIWEYVKLNNLQNPANKREIYCDAKLKTIFDGKEQVGFLEISKLLTPHFLKSS